MSDKRNSPLIDQFLDAVWLESGLSANTLTAYRTDLKKMSDWLGKQKRTMDEASKSELLDYLAHTVRSGISARSSARQLTSLRRFYRYFAREGIAEAVLLYTSSAAHHLPYDDIGCLRILTKTKHQS